MSMKLWLRMFCNQYGHNYKFDYIQELAPGIEWHWRKCTMCGVSILDIKGEDG